MCAGLPAFHLDEDRGLQVPGHDVDLAAPGLEVARQDEIPEAFEVLESRVFAQDPAGPDAEGCKEPTLVSRVKRCWITACERKEFDSVELFSGPPDKRTEEAPVRTVEGEKEFVSYVCPGSLSKAQLYRNVEAALRSASFPVLYKPSRR